MNQYFIAILFLLAATPLAASPAGHPSVGAAQEYLQLPNGGSLSYQGQILQSIPSNDYVYLEVTKKEGGSRWLAAPRAAVPVQSYIRYGEGVVIKNFFSRKHKRTFHELMFVSRIQLLGN